MKPNNTLTSRRAVLAQLGAAGALTGIVTLGRAPEPTPATTIGTTHRLTLHALILLGFAALSAPAVSATPQDPGLIVKGRVLDLPVAYPDGSVRFHVLPEGKPLRQPESAAQHPPDEKTSLKALDSLGNSFSPDQAGFVALPVGGSPVAMTLYQDSFKSANSGTLDTPVGSAEVKEGRLHVVGPQTVVLAGGVCGRDVTVSVTGDADLQFGVILRYQDTNNYLMAFYSPAQGIVAFHERVGGNWGGYGASQSVPPQTTKRLRLTVGVEGNRLRAVLTDEVGTSHVCAGPVSRLLESGGAGVYFDTAAKAGAQALDDLAIHGQDAVVQNDAVQVMALPSAVTNGFVWNLGEYVRVSGSAAEALTLGGTLEALAVSRSEDLQNIGPKTLFPARAPAGTWASFPAAGFRHPVTGIIYTDPGTVRPVSGMPLGALDTGCLDLETTGTFGYSSIFNHLTPRGGPLNSPFLGISVGGTTWVLTTGKTKGYDNGRDPIPAPGPDLALEGVRKARRIAYWGHYPVADLEYETEAPVAVSLRAWAPFLPGDADAANTPAAVFEVHLSNTSSQEQQGTLAFSFPGLAAHASTMKPGGPGSQYSAMVKDFPAPKIVRQPLTDGVTGVAVTDENWKMGYTLGMIGTLPVRSGGALGVDGTAWEGISRQLPGTTADDGGSSLAVDFKLAAGEQKTVRFLLAWYAPEWKGGGAPQSAGPGFTHMYAARFANAAAVAQFVGREHVSLLRRILAWQAEIYDTPNLPGWLADSLINNFCLIAEDSIWAQAMPPVGAWCRADEGAFGMNEAPRPCAQMNTLPNSAIGNLPITYFFPKLDRSYVRQFGALQTAVGDIPCVIGNGTWEFGVPRSYGYQLVMNGANYMALLDRHYMVTGDEEFLKEFYPVAKRTCKFSFNLRPSYGPSQIMAMQPEGVGMKISWLGNSTLTEWFEDRVFHGYQVHAGGFRMAAARMMRRWAEKMGDQEYMAELDAMLAAGAKAMEDHLWAGDHYLLYNEPETGKKLDVVFTPSFDGQLYAWQHGLPRVFPKERIDTVLGLMRKVCVISKHGIPPTYASPAGKSWSDNAGYLTGNFNYVNQTIYFIAMTYMYEGQKDFGLELLRQTLELDFCQRGYTWDGVHVASPKADDGERAYGTDYYMRLALWGVPAAIDGASIKDAMKSGGLVDRVIKAARTR